MSLLLYVAIDTSVELPERRNNTTVYNCAANCGVFNNGSYSEAYSLGGIIGYLSNNKACNYENLVNYTSINDVGDGIGGIIGHADCSSNITLRKVVNLKNLTANYRIGGIIGEHFGNKRS